jgi:hypothetical protein
MTLIACLAADNYPVLIADGLTSSLKGQPNIRLPTIGDHHYQLQGTSKLKVHGTIEKLVRLGTNAIVAWAGDCYLATNLLKGIADLFGAEIGTSRNGVGSGRMKRRHHVEFAAEEEDSGAVVFEAAEAAGVGFDGLDLGVEAFGEGVGDAVPEVGEQAA